MDDEFKNLIDDYYESWFGVNAVYEQWAKRQGLTFNSLFILYIIHENAENCTQKLICGKLLLPKQTVNTILDTFEKNGLVRKEILKEDRRNKCLKFTEKGQRYSDSLIEKLYRFEKDALIHMEPSERQSMIDTNRIYLKRLNESLEKDK